MSMLVSAIPSRVSHHIPWRVSRFAAGFAACPVVTTVVEWLQLGLVLAYCAAHRRTHHLRTAWPMAGWALRSHVTPQRVRQYLRQYVPAAASIGSDWWRLSAVGAIATTLGPLELAIFSASYRIM
jgi:hypothetical protein